MQTTLSLANALGLFVSLVLPLLVALVTKMTTHPAVKSLLLLAFTVVTTSLTELLKALASGDGVSYVNWAIMLIFAYVSAVAAHYGLWRPTGLAGAAQNSLITATPTDDGQALSITGAGTATSDVAPSPSAVSSSLSSLDP